MSGSASFILAYHSLDRSGSVISVTPETFREHMHLLATSGRPVVRLEEALTVPGAVALTFDDGYLNFYDCALDILEQHGFPATVFVVSGRCGQTASWQGAAAEVLMDWSHLAEAGRRGVSIGGHSVSHPDLTRLPAAEMRAEIADCRDTIRDRLGVSPTSFAYPYGASQDHVRSAAKEAFSLACGTRLGFLRTDSSRYDLPRIDIYYFRDSRRFQDLLAGRAGAYLRLRKFLRTVRKCVLG